MPKSAAAVRASARTNHGVHELAQFVAVDPEGLSDRELIEAALRSAQETHRCTHQTQQELAEFRNAQEIFNAEARSIRHAQGNAIMALEGLTTSVLKRIGEMSLQQGIDTGRINTIAKMFGAEAWEPGEQRIAPTVHAAPKGQSLQKVGIIAALAVGLAALASNAGVYTFVKGQLIAADTSLTDLAKK